MKTNKIIFLLSLLVFLISCACQSTDCPADGGSITVEIFQDNMPIVDEHTETISLTRMVGSVELEYQIFPSNNILNLFIHNSVPGILKVDGIEIGRFLGRTEILSSGRCCDTFGLIDLSFNNVQLCDNGCQETIRIDL